MKLARTIFLCLAGSLVMAARADDAALPGNPYAMVVERNIFGLNPPPPPTVEQTDEVPFKIMPNGIMTIFGQLQVLFKVSDPGSAGRPGGVTDYILSEGQRQDDVEVIKIDEKAGMVTFNNHGTVQELAVVPASSAAPAVADGRPAFSVPPPPGSGQRFGNNFGGSRGSFGGAFGRQNFGNQNSSGNSGFNNNFNNGNLPEVFVPPTNNPAYNNAVGQIPEGQTPEMQTVIIEANRQNALQQGDGTAALYPTTELTSQTTENGGGVSAPQTQAGDQSSGN